jgi:hypothetical protein
VKHTQSTERRVFSFLYYGNPRALQPASLPISAYVLRPQMARWVLGAPLPNGLDVSPGYQTWADELTNASCEVV